MATIISKTEVCDICKNPRRKVRAYRVGDTDELLDFHLCSGDGKGVQSLLDSGTGRVVTLHSPKLRVALSTMEDIEEAKGRRNPPQSAGD